MSFEHPGDAFDRSQPTPDRPAVPALKKALGFCGVKIAPEFSEKFFELPGSGDLASTGTQGVKFRLVGLIREAPAMRGAYKELRGCRAENDGRRPCGRFEGEPKRLELRLEHVAGQHFECPLCKALCGIRDPIERRWRHLNFFQYRCELVAKVPRTWCRKDGVHQVQCAGSGKAAVLP